MTPLERLFALEQFGIKLGLENIRILVDALGRPQDAWRSVHIAGTNGKGSVAAMVERGFRAAGLRTGRYTSPHLSTIEERVALDGVAVDRATFAAVTADVLGVMDGCLETGALTVSPTFFEVSTAIAFEIFRRAKVDVAVVEVGLGGRFDATNILTPEVAAITTIAFDHERHLGRTLAAIAYEKAGIAKRGVPLVVGRVPAEAADKIRQVASDAGAAVVDAHATTTDRVYPPMKLALPGRHQLENAAVAVGILETWSAMVSPIPTEAIVTGLTECVWSARLEWLRLPGGASLLIDAAHNPSGALALADYLRDAAVAPVPIVFAVMEDKDVGGMVAALAPVASMFVATTVAHKRAKPAGALAEVIRRMAPGINVEVEESPEAAVARVVAGHDRAVAAGSIFLIGPLRARLLASGAERV